MQTKNIQQKSLSADEAIKYALSSVLKQLAAAAAGFLFASASFEGLSPFGASFAAGVFPEYIPASVLGSAGGYFFTYGVNVLTLRYIASAVIAGIISFLLKRNFKRQYFKQFSAAAGFIALLSTGLVLSISITVSADEILLYSAEGAAGAAAALFIDRFLNINPIKKYISRLTGIETASVLVVFSILLMSLSSFDIYIFSPEIIIGTYIVLVASSYGGEKYGSLLGICAGVVSGFSGENGFITGAFAMGGLLSGIFGRKNRFISAVIFIITVAAGAFSAKNRADAVYVLYDVGIAAAAFILTPKRLSGAYKKIFSLSDDGAFLSGQRNTLKMRLLTASDGMKDVAASVKAVAGIYRRRTFPKKEKIYENVCVKICRECPDYVSCWNAKYTATYGYFSKIIEALKNGEEPDDKSIPKGFLSICREPQNIIKSLGYEVECYRSAMRESAKTGETVNIVSDQFGSVSDLLDEFSLSIESGDEYDAARSGLVLSFLENDMRLSVLSCGVFTLPEGNIYCELSFAPYKKYDYEKISRTLSASLGVQLEKPVTRELSDGTVIFTVCEKTKYKLVSGGKQISIDKNNRCGDTFDSFYDGKGNFIMILSDGMGTGKKAAADSVMCCSLASVLLRSGYPIDSILKMINSAMLVRSGEESLATLDIAVINLYTGETEIRKAGAGSSVAMKNYKMLQINKPSLPVGILQDVAFEKMELKLGDGDTLVLMSDGVTKASLSVWREILKTAADYEGGELAEKLAKTAKLNSDDETADDITVVTAVIEMNN